MKFSRLTLTAFAASAMFFTTSGIKAQDASTSANADKNFVMMADEGNTAEITASKMALKKSHNPDVKAYAQKMIDDHMKLRSDLAPFAQQMGVTTPQPLNETHNVMAHRLAALSGDKFDMEYVKDMDQDHHKTLGMFQNEIATTQNDSLKTTVQQGAQVVQAHTDMADQMAQKMNIPTTSTPTSGQ